MRIFVFLAIIILGSAVAGGVILSQEVPKWKLQTTEILAEAREAHFDSSRWNQVFEKAEDLPDVFPVSLTKEIFFEAKNIFIQLDKINLTISRIWNNEINTKLITEVFNSLHKIDHSLLKIEKKLSYIPGFLLTEKQRQEKAKVIFKIQKIRKRLADYRKLERIFNDFVKDKRRLLILLQNQNEPRSTGGFVGSFVTVDFSPEKIIWKFNDIYALDRKVPPHVQIPAPEFFHGLSQKISLRDANFWPHFPASAQKYRTFFAESEEKPPHTIIAINLNVIREILKIVGPVDFHQWGLTLDEYNFDMGLSFLVESKISGRFAVKKPVLDFAKALFAIEKWEQVSIDHLLSFNMSEFLDQKNILAYSKDRSLQKLFQKWDIDGEMKMNKEADNFLYFDFISIGANKSDKFLWTKLWHDSEIHQDGKVINTLKITRNHALRPGEIQDLLRTKNWSPNIRSLLTDDLVWKLGAGQNRTILRIFVPKDAKLIAQTNPSGEIREVISDDRKFKIFEVPMFVLPGERLKISFKYETELDRGSHDWRPYFLQVVGTPGRNQTSFLKTISTEVEGRFTAETHTLGRPQKLIDNDYRAVIEFD